MSWFSNNKKKADVHRTINRILNASVSIESHLQFEQEVDQRDDVRLVRITPVVILPLLESEDEDLITLGLTQDLSCEGMAVSTLGALPVDTELAVGIGNGSDFSVLLCECVRSQPIGYGFFENGVHVKEVLPAGRYLPLQEFAEFLEANPPKSMLSLMERA